MGKLKNLRPLLGSLVPTIAYTQDTEATDRRIAPPQSWKRWYHSARWQALRMSVFERDLFICQMCGKLEGNTKFLTADHRTPHRGNPKLFWDKNNIQTLCTSPCHVKWKQREEVATPQGVWD